MNVDVKNPSPSSVSTREIKGLNEDLVRDLTRYARLHDLTVGEAMNQAIRAYLARVQPIEKNESLNDVPTADFGEGSENSSTSIDETLYEP